MEWFPTSRGAQGLTPGSGLRDDSCCQGAAVVASQPLKVSTSNHFLQLLRSGPSSTELTLLPGSQAQSFSMTE